MFKGFLKAVLIIGVLLSIYFGASMSSNTTTIVMGTIVYIVGIITVIPLAIHGGLRYRMSRTSWRGIHFGYRGNLRELLELYFKGVMLTIFTFGIYGSWLSASLRRFITDNVRLGNTRFRFDGEGKELFIINLKGILLLYPTLGIYTFWWIKNLNHYHINHMHIEQDGNTFGFTSNLSAGEIFSTTFTNNLLIIFTLGLGTPWAILRSMRMVLNNAELAPGFNPDAVLQTEEAYTDATGDDLLSMLDIGLDF
jgi:uncharacterized membrane protein YjgN (DUF898 family)